MAASEPPSAKVGDGGRMESIGRNPNSADKIQTPLIIGLPSWRRSRSTPW
jgi:hypothetical protein